MTVYDNGQNKRKTGATSENEGVTFIKKEQKDKAWEEKKQLNCFHCGEKGHIKSECPKYKATTNTTVEDVPNEVGRNVNEAKGSDSDGQSVTRGVTQSTKDGTTVDNGCSFNFAITSEGNMNMNEKNRFVLFQQNRKRDKVNQIWVLLGSQSTIEVFVNADLL